MKQLWLCALLKGASVMTRIQTQFQLLTTPYLGSGELESSAMTSYLFIFLWRDWVTWDIGHHSLQSFDWSTFWVWSIKIIAINQWGVLYNQEIYHQNWSVMKILRYKIQSQRQYNDLLIWWNINLIDPLHWRHTLKKFPHWGQRRQIIGR